MGATYNEAKLTGTPEQVRMKFEQLQDQDRYENGHSYSGGFGMTRGLQFARANVTHTEAEAHDWLIENCNKWSAAIALRLDKDEYLVGAWCSS